MNIETFTQDIVNILFNPGELHHFLSYVSDQFIWAGNEIHPLSRDFKSAYTFLQSNLDLNIVSTHTSITPIQKGLYQVKLQIYVKDFQANESIYKLIFIMTIHEDDDSYKIDYVYVDFQMMDHELKDMHSLNLKDEELNKIFNLATDGIVKIIGDGKYTVVYYNPPMVSMLGVNIKSLQTYQLEERSYIHVEDQDLLKKSLDQAFLTQESFNIKIRLYHIDGHEIWCKVNGIILPDYYQGKYPIYYLIFTDIHELMKMNQKLQIQSDRYKAFTELVYEAFFEYDVQKDTLYLYGEYSPLYKGNPIIPHFSDSQIYYKDDFYKENYLKLFKIFQESKKDIDIEKAFLRPDGTHKYQRILGKKIYNEDGFVSKILGKMVDTHDAYIKKQELVLLSQQDSMTALLNKVSFQQKIKEDLGKKKNNYKAFIIIDIDEFKMINDTFGHSVGDDAIHKLADCLRHTFHKNAVLGRFGGDEFVVYLNDIQPNQVDAIILQFQDQVKALYTINMNGFELHTSIGAILTNQNMTYTQLFNDADQALYQVKQSGRNHYKIKKAI